MLRKGVANYKTRIKNWEAFKTKGEVRRVIGKTEDG
jgi:hypothetical protein